MYKSPLILACSLLIFSLSMHGQNLFANPGFEVKNMCAENGMTCCPEAWFNIPATIFSVYTRHAKRPVLGRDILAVPVENVLTGYAKKRCVYTMLACPLIKGEKYSLSFYIAATERLFERLDFFFTTAEPSPENIDELAQTPAFRITERNIDAAYNSVWSHVQYEFTAASNAQFCIIGNFSELRNRHTARDAMSKEGDIYYFLDEISLKPISGLALCAGYADNIKKIYAQNYRHTDSVRIHKEIPVPVTHRDTVVIPAVLFDVNSTVLKPAILSILDSVVTKIGQSVVEKVEINGHTDNTGRAATNEALSLARAGSVKKYLDTKLPLLSIKIVISGKGQNFPVAGNDTESGRARNRRVEIILTTLVNGNQR